jgi:hypothetical protein
MGMTQPRITKRKTSNRSGPKTAARVTLSRLGRPAPSTTVLCGRGRRRVGQILCGDGRPRGSRFPCLFLEVLVHLTCRDRAFTDGGGDALHRAAADAEDYPRLLRRRGDLHCTGDPSDQKLGQTWVKRGDACATPAHGPQRSTRERVRPGQEDGRTSGGIVPL